MSQKIPLPHSVKALAASAAVQFAKDLCIHKIEFKGDSLLVISALRGSRPSFTLHGHIIEDTKLLASSLPWFNFRHVNFSKKKKKICRHVKRVGNCLAYVLLRRAISFASLDIWVEELLSGLKAVFQNNLN